MSTSTVLVFPGQGSQWAGMAAELLNSNAVFTTRLRECAAAVARYVGWDVGDVLRQRPGAPTLDRVEVVQPALWSVHVALAALWLASGLVPRAVIGQSQGEIAAACVSGALTLDDAARVITFRSELFARTLVGTGGIASIRLSANDIACRLGVYDGRLEIAGDIGPQTCTLAGDVTALDDLVARLTDDGVKACLIPASIPSHCFAIEPLRDQLVQGLVDIRPQPTQIPMYSTVTGNAVDGAELNAGYWYDNARLPVLFQPGIDNLLARGARVFVESSAHPVLTSAIRATGQACGVPVVVTGTLRRGHGDIAEFRSAVACVAAGSVSRRRSGSDPTTLVR
ncbi:acyl transferase family protein [Mycobacterium sp. BK086]|uniref:acyltransferase domain-containing protein n=1 Tax=Mycobacterium sp. BK086 TaxID=2512165 RepID=UPI00105E5D3B|nr:acyltransferase domain-containing protein [Mycobacterium sp. BK086]TDO08844.1 acyl transferase family protein [Mycobacterium sp. BK086]